MVPAAEKEEDRHAQLRHALEKIEPRYLVPHGIDRKPEAAHRVRHIDDRGLGTAENNSSHVPQRFRGELAI